MSLSVNELATCKIKTSLVMVLISVNQGFTLKFKKHKYISNSQLKKKYSGHMSY